MSSFTVPTVLIAESNGFSPAAVNRLDPVSRVQLGDLNRNELLSRMDRVDVLWVRLRSQIDRQIMDAGPRLRAIATATTGLNHIDTVEARSRGIAVISLRGETEFLRTIRATAEHTIALIFGLIRHVPQASHHVNDGSWDRDLFMGQELAGKTAGIVGYGRVGRMVAHYLRAFGMNVLVNDPFVETGSIEEGVESLPLDRLLERSDLVSLHVSLSDETQRFFGEREFSKMKQGVWLINTARGELVNEAALLAVLQSGYLAGAALDVLADECSQGMGGHPLVAYARNNSNLLITPHIGGCTFESREKTELFIAGRVVDFLLSRNQGAGGHEQLGYVKVEKSN